MEADRPRKLTKEEIDDILNVIPEIRSIADTVSTENTKSMKTMLREQLEDIEITPLGLTDLKNEMLRQFANSRARPGDMVGVLSSDACSKPITQMALNSFHQSGSSRNVTAGVARISELINATSNPKKTSASIYFKDQNLSFDDIIIDKRVELVEVTVQDLVVGLPEIETVGDFEEPYWYTFFRLLVRDDFTSKDVLRLKIDTNLLFAYKITMEDIANKIEMDGSVICVYSPMNEGRMDIYPIENSITRELNSKKMTVNENAALIFLQMIVIPNLDNIKISGITGIQQIYPVKAPVLQIIKEERYESDDVWFLILNPIRMRITGISVEKLVTLIEAVDENKQDITVLKIRPNYLAVKSKISPLKFINEAVNKDEKEEKAYYKRKREVGEKIVRKTPTKISKASKLIYADSTGSNLKELLANPTIDSTRTFCNDVHEIYAAFGIEAARTFLIKEFIEVIGYEGYINPRHIELLVDFMTNRGAVNGVTFSGVSRQPIGALEKASYEKAMEVFREAGGFGEIKSVSGTSASIFIGKKALIGTGYSQDYMRPENLDRYNKTRRELLETEGPVLDINNFKDAIGEIDIGTGEDVAVLEGDLNAMFGLGVEGGFGDVGVGGETERKIETERKVKTVVSSVPIPNETVIVKGKMVVSSDLQNIADELQSEISASIVCGVGEKKEGLFVESGEKISDISQLKVVAPTKLKRAQVKIFDLEEFVK